MWHRPCHIPTPRPLSASAFPFSLAHLSSSLLRTGMTLTPGHAAFPMQDCGDQTNYPIALTQTIVGNRSQAAPWRWDPLLQAALDVNLSLFLYVTSPFTLSQRHGRNFCFRKHEAAYWRYLLYFANYKAIATLEFSQALLITANEVLAFEFYFCKWGTIRSFIPCDQDYIACMTGGFYRRGAAFKSMITRKCMDCPIESDLWRQCCVLLIKIMIDQSNVAFC